MAFDGNKPAVTDGKVSVLSGIRANFARMVTMFQGGAGSDTNIPTNAKRIDNDGSVYYWNGSAWTVMGDITDGAEANPAVTTTAEIDTGTSTAERVVTPALLKYNAETWGGGGGAEYTFATKTDYTGSVVYNIINQTVSGLQAGDILEYQVMGYYTVASSIQKSVRILSSSDTPITSVIGPTYASGTHYFSHKIRYSVEATTGVNKIHAILECSFDGETPTMAQASFNGTASINGGFYMNAHSTDTITVMNGSIRLLTT